jgi:hypothetical protein
MLQRGIIDTSFYMFSFECRAFLSEFETEFKMTLARESEANSVLFAFKKRRIENLVSLSLDWTSS